jgi:hypothetical protein
MLIQLYIYTNFKFLIDDVNDIKYLVHSDCSEIKLRSIWNKDKIENAGFISTNLEINGLLESIMRVYSSYFLWNKLY